MAAPTNVKVESNSLTTATLRWVYGGAASIAVFRSTDGVAYSEITSEVLNTRVAVGTLIYIDDTGVPGTKYYYKLSDDGGATFSSVVVVVTQACLPPAGSLDTFSLPRAETPEVPTDTFNNLAERVENILAGRVLAPDTCIACITDGAIVLNCAANCREWLVVVDEDINSISIQYCANDEGTGGGGGNIDFLIPPGTTRSINGWPNGFGASGNQPAVSGGICGRTMSVGIKKIAAAAVPTVSVPCTGTGIQTGGGSGAALGCNCSAVDGALTIKSCNANNSLNCATSKSLMLIACGGRAPYRWSRTGGVSLKGSGPMGTTANGTTITVTPPTNNGGAVVGEAYRSVKCACSAGILEFIWSAFNCNDSAFVTPNCAETSSGSPMVCNNGNIVGCVPLGLTCQGDGTGFSCAGGGKSTSGVAPCTVCGGTVAPGQLCDVRTAPMIAAGCAPCGLQNGSTVSVTDAIGTVVTIILRN